MDAGKRRALERKRKAQRAKELSRLPVTPYEGAKYRAERWVPHVYATEQAVYETILLSAGRLTNQQVRTAFEQLVRRLRSNQPGPLPEGETETVYASGDEVEFLIWNIRNHWRGLVNEVGNVDKEDLIGILHRSNPRYPPAETYYCLAFHSELDVLAVGSGDGMVTLYHVPSGKVTEKFIGHTASVLSVAWGAQWHSAAFGQRRWHGILVEYRRTGSW